MTTSPTDTARSLARAKPAARLPCPVCAVSLRAANLDAHLEKVHPHIVDAPMPWRATDPHPAERRAGWYLRVGDIVVGCRQSTSFRQHWDSAGWRAGERRLTCDVIVTQPVMVAIEYTLAARGLLAPSARP